jgi:hypothetical protein
MSATPTTPTTATATSGPYPDGDPTLRYIDRIQADLRRIASRVEDIEKERFRWRDLTREVFASVRRAATVLAWAFAVVAVLGGTARLCFLGSAWGEHARRLAEREAVAYVRATTPTARVVLVACRPSHRNFGTDMRCIVTLDGVRGGDLSCDDDEPGYNDGCVSVQSPANGGQ